MFFRTRPFAITPRTRIPTNVPKALPRPPDSAVPPMITAARMSSKSVPLDAAYGATAPADDARTIPDMPANTAARDAFAPPDSEGVQTEARIP
jgi:hypothetical protein